jgi:copper(I)-binding protein
MKLLAATMAVALPVLLSSCGSSAATTQEAAVSTPSVLVEDACVRATTGGKDTTMTAAFMSLTNPGNTDIKLTSATSTPPCGRPTVPPGSAVVRRLSCAGSG